MPISKQPLSSPLTATPWPQRLRFMVMLLWAVWSLTACQVVVVDPTPTLEPQVLVPLTPTLVQVTPLPTAPVSPAEATSTSALPPVDTTPRATAVEADVNLRTGPGLEYEVVGILPAGQSLEITGRSPDATWWLVSTPTGERWLAAGVVRATNVERGVPVAFAPPTPTSGVPTNTPIPVATSTPPGPPPPPALTPTPVPPTPTPMPQYQYTIRNIFGQVNEAITQIRGDVRERNNNPVNGVRVRVRSGSFCTVSYPSGPAGGYPNGNYDILLDNRAKDGTWQVAVIDASANPNDTQCHDGQAVLSEEVTVPTNTKQGVVFVEWWKNY